MSTELYIVISLVFLITVTKCDFFSTPRSQILYEGDRTTLACHIQQGDAFWQLNGTIYSELNAVYFESRGITSFDFFLGDSELNKTLTIVGSELNNNTIISCISVQQNAVNTSENATITVLGPPSNVTLNQLNSTSVEVTWSESFVPPTVTIQRYSVTVFNTSQPNNHQWIEAITDADSLTSDGLFSQIFNFDQELTQCTQITFSVTSTSSIGTSPPSNVSWELPLYIGNSGPDFKDSLSCSVSLDTKTLTVSFKPHKLCAFQSANYMISITKNGGSVASTSGSFSGNQQQATIQHTFTDQNVQLEQAALVSVTSQLYGNEQASVKCYLKEKPSIPAIGGLDVAPGSESGGFSSGFIAGVTISSIVVLLALVAIIGVLIYSIWKQPIFTKSDINHKALL